MIYSIMAHLKIVSVHCPVKLCDDIFYFEIFCISTSKEPNKYRSIHQMREFFTHPDEKGKGGCIIRRAT